MILILAVACGCARPGGSNNAELIAIDSLLYQNRVLQAREMLQRMNREYMNDEDLAYHTLLSVQADVENKTASGDADPMGQTVKHYKNSGDHEKYARALLYQGGAYGAAGELDKAISCLRKAEDVAASDDLKNRAMAKMMMGELYQSQVVGAKTVGAEKYREALELFRQIDDRHHQIICLSELGGLYRISKEKQDSAMHYINAAIDLAKQEIEPQAVVANLFSRAEYRAARGDYQGAKDDAIEAIAWSGDMKIHPRIHYTAASAFLHLGRIDSARYYLQQAPEMASAADSIMHYQLLADMARHDHKLEEAIDYLTKTHHLADSVTMSGMNDKLMEVEKKYDSQKADLENALLSSRLKGTLLVLALLALAAGALAFLLWRYRNRLKIQQAEYELMKSDLDQSITSLQQMQETLANRDSSKQQSDELKTIVDSQMKVVHQLLQWSYECNETTFAKRFNKLMTMRGPDQVGSSYWDNLQALANEMYDNVLVKAQEAAGGTLREDEINMIALHCHGFSRTVIMMCMHYTNLRTVSNKRIQIAHKLHVATLDEFLQPFLSVRS
ncbi:MAG: hypothetical protein IJV05_09555 [Muribaculaceae bacterium]|nr:hypothetical protein [Muribaculaceae bacterium]